MLTNPYEPPKVPSKRKRVSCFGDWRTFSLSLAVWLMLVLISFAIRYR